jgi:hypothetical protein
MHPLRRPGGPTMTRAGTGGYAAIESRATLGKTLLIV